MKVVLPLQSESAQRARNLHAKPNGHVLQKEDRAPCHLADVDTHTRNSGWMEARREALSEARLIRHLFALNATPDDCENDQMHHIFELELDKEIRELSGRCQNWLLRPSDELLENGMNFMTKRGYDRGATHYIIGAAIARVWSRWPQAHCLASFVKTGSVPRELATSWMSEHAGGLDRILTEFEQLQATVRQAMKWKHPEQSGIAKQHNEALDLDWSWLKPSVASSDLTTGQEEELAIINAINVEVQQKSTARTLVEIMEQIGHFKETAVSSDEVIGSEDANLLDTTAGPHNAAQPQPFSQCMDVLLRETPTFKHRGQPFMHCVWEWQLWLLRNSWTKLRMEQNPSVKRVSRDQYVWRILKRVQGMALLQDLEVLTLSMVGDYRRLSMNPRGAPKGKPKPKSVLSSKAAAFAKPLSLKAAVQGGPPKKAPFRYPAPPPKKAAIEKSMASSAKVASSSSKKAAIGLEKAPSSLNKAASSFFHSSANLGIIFAELAKSGQSSCYWCKKKITVGSPRMAYAFHVKRPEAYIHPTCAPMMPAEHRAVSIKTLKSLPDDAPSILKDAAHQALGAHPRGVC